ncbi:MAG TPA: efflux RND transporter periplasmic adaptor subunit [Bryobacteraceae bacterium]|nr:efflux RND transporter periplasmic adaptor subunit [Bryobacteraceae bacterium]
MRYLLTLSTLIVFVFLTACGSKQAKQGMPAFPPVAVRAVAAVSSNVPLVVSAIGNVEALTSVDVKSQVAGQILAVHFAQGQEVQKGQLLFEIDPETYNRQLTEQEAELARDAALEAQSKANVEKDAAMLKSAKAQADRAVSLAKDGIFSTEQTEQLVATSESDQAALDADRAAVDSEAAAVVADRAKIAETRLQLTYTGIVAPITGRAGAINLQPGNLVKDNDTNAMVTILEDSPIYVDFSVPEQLLPEVRKYDAMHPLLVTAVVNGKSADGRLDFIDNTVDTTTGTIKLKAKFNNSDRMLWPGQFVDVHAQLNIEPDRVVVPNRTVQTGPDGGYVWVMNPANSTVAMRPVHVERTFKENGDELAVVSTGLQPGEMVISEGQMRLMPGAKVHVMAALPTVSEVATPGTPGA